MANKVRFGFSKVHVAFWDAQTSEYDTPTAIPGAVSASLEPEGESEPFFADNIAYYEARSNQGYTGDLEMALIPDDVLAEMLGWEIDENGALIEIADAEPKPFALLGQIDGDSAGRRFCFFNVSANRPTETASTKTASTEVAPSTLPIVVTPKVIADRTVVKSTVEDAEATAATYAGWFTAVTLPEFASA